MSIIKHNDGFVLSICCWLWIYNWFKIWVRKDRAVCWSSDGWLVESGFKDLVVSHKSVYHIIFNWPKYAKPNFPFFVWFGSTMPANSYSMRHVRLCYSDLPVELVASIHLQLLLKQERKILWDKESFIVYKTCIRLIIMALDSPIIIIWSLSVIITSKSTFDAVDVNDTHVTSQINMPKPSHRPTDPQCKI